MASRLRSILSPIKPPPPPLRLKDASREGQRPRTTLPTPPPTVGLNRAFTENDTSPEALLSSSRAYVRSSEVSDETIRERLAELEEAYELATYYSRGESRVKLLQEELAEQKTVHLSLKAEIESHVNKEFQLKQQVQQLEQDYELSIHYVRATTQSMKRMKSELKRYQASEVTPPSAPPSARKSLDLDISLARNEIPTSPVSNYVPVAVEPYRTLVISAPIEEQNTPVVPHSAQPGQTKHGVVTGNASTSARETLDGAAARDRWPISSDSERALHTPKSGAVRDMLLSDDSSRLPLELKLPALDLGERSLWPQGQNVDACRRSFHVPWLGKTSEAGRDHDSQAAFANPSLSSLVNGHSPRLSGEDTVQQRPIGITTKSIAASLSTYSASRTSLVSSWLAHRSCFEPLSTVSPLPAVPPIPRGHSAPSSANTAGTFWQTRSRQSLLPPVPRVVLDAPEVSSSQSRDSRGSSESPELCDEGSLSMRPISSIMTAEDSTVVPGSTSQGSQRSSLSSRFLPPTPIGPLPATRQELEEALQSLASWKPSSDDTLIAQVWIHWIDSNLQTANERDPSYIPLLHHLRGLCRLAQRLPPSYRLDPSEVRLRQHEPVFTSAHSDVYKATRHGKLVALKTIRVNGESREDVRRAFHGEAVMWKFLRHPNIVSFIGVSPMFPICLVSEWMPNGDVGQYLKMHGSADRVFFLNEVIDGLQHMHSLDMIHGDLKASNILVDADGHARLTDFGLSTLLFGNMTFTGSESPCGTIPFMAPEILQGSSAVTIMSDVYALGMVVYELFNGTAPFAEERNEIALIMPIILGKRPERPVAGEQLGLTDALWAITNCCWDTDPLQRPTLEEVKYVCRVGSRRGQPAQNPGVALEGPAAQNSVPLGAPGPEDLRRASGRYTHILSLLEIPGANPPLDGIDWEDEFEDDVEDVPVPALTHAALQSLSTPRVLHLMHAAAASIRAQHRQATNLLRSRYGHLLHLSPVPDARDESDVLALPAAQADFRKLFRF